MCEKQDGQPCPHGFPALWIQSAAVREIISGQPADVPYRGISRKDWLKEVLWRNAFGRLGKSFPSGQSGDARTCGVQIKRR